MEVRRFRFGTDETEWNRFIQRGWNSTFLFDRHFMDYHRQRFTDHSVMVYDKGQLTACFPANEVSSTEICSHQGLTYGAFVIKPEAKLPVQMEIFKNVLAYYADNGFANITYKAFPRFYNALQTDEIEYCLFRSNSRLYRRDTAIAIDKRDPVKYSGNIRREARKARERGIVVQEDQDFDNFWENVLTPNLVSRFDVKPVHSSSEIKQLKADFPEEIKLYTATDENEKILAGTVFFLTERVAHCQYISASNEGRESGALNLLFTTLLDEYFQEKPYFDLGIVNEAEGREINGGLLGWKERLGGRTYSHDFYKIETSSYKLL